MPAFSHDIKELVLSGINIALEHGAQLLKPCFAVSSFYCRLVRSCHTSAKNAGRRTSCCFSAFMNILYSHTQILFIHTWTTSPTLYLSFHNVNEQTTICRVVCTDFAKYSDFACYVGEKLCFVSTLTLNRVSVIMSIYNI